MSLIVYNVCEAIKLLIIAWVYICISFNELTWLIQKNEKIDILSLLFMPFTGNKSPGAKKGSDEWQCDNFTNIFWVKRTFTNKHYFGQPIISLNDKVDAISWVESDHVWAVRPSVSKIRLGRVGFGPKN